MKKLGNVVVVLLIILLTAIVGFGGWYFVKRDRESSEKIEKLENQIANLNNKENNAVENNKDDNSKNNKTEEANEAIRKALKDENWVAENISEKNVKLSDNETYPANIYIYKMGNDEETPVYIAVTRILDGFTVQVVTYKNGEVIVSKASVNGEYSFIKVNTKSNQIAIVNDPTNEGKIYQIIGSEFSVIGYNYENEQTYKNGYYQLYGKEVSKNEYEKVINEMEEVEIYDNNVDNYYINPQTIDKIVK